MESTLTLTRSKLRSQVGFFLGWGYGPDFGGSDWSDDQVVAIDDAVASGLRRFYFPEQPQGGFYDWSFLRPTTTQFFPADNNTIILPDDFGGVQGVVTVATVGSGTGLVWWPLLTTNEAAIRLLFANFPNATGRPTQVAVSPLKGTTINQGQRYQMLCYPTPDQEYQIQFQYTILPDALTLNTPIPYGGAQHAETILESCLAVAEERLDDQKTTHADSFLRRLNASMAQDRRLKPQQMGYNQDSSDRVWSRYGDRVWNTVQYQGNNL